MITVERPLSGKASDTELLNDSIELGPVSRVVGLSVKTVPHLVQMVSPVESVVDQPDGITRVAKYI